MNKFTIRLNGMIQGTFSGAKEADALDAFAEAAGVADFAAYCAANKVTRDNFKVEQAASA